jgi:hypothetical protein
VAALYAAHGLVSTKIGITIQLHILQLDHMLGQKFRAGCSYFQLARLQDDALVAGAAGDLFAVEVFQKRDGVLARDAGEILEGSDVD